MADHLSLETLYEQHIKRLPVRDRLRLMAMVANDLTDAPEVAVPHRVSPRLARPEQAADFQMEVAEVGPDAGV